MNEYPLSKYFEFMTFFIYLMFIFLVVQIWLFWKDVDKNELKVKTIVKESFFKKNCIYVVSFSLFFMTHGFVEGIDVSNAIIYSKFLETLGIISLLLFAYGWYGMLKTCVHKNSLPQELTNVHGSNRPPLS